MADNLTPAQRSQCMARVRGKDTAPERRLRSALHREGLRFRKHTAGVPGRPDVVFQRARLAVFVDGDFWHGYRFPAWRTTLAPFWQVKIAKNRARDRRNFQRLRRRGWRVLRLWTHELERNLPRCIARVRAALGAA